MGHPFMTSTRSGGRMRTEVISPMWTSDVHTEN